MFTITALMLYYHKIFACIEQSSCISDCESNLALLANDHRTAEMQIGFQTTRLSFDIYLNIQDKLKNYLTHRYIISAFPIFIL